MKTPKHINLTPSQIDVLNQLKKRTWTSTHKFRENNIFHPSARIMEIKAKGAIIKTNRIDITIDGKLHPDVGHYRLIGWEV